VSNHLNTPQNASDGSVSPETEGQPQSRRERRLLSGSSRVAGDGLPQPVSASELISNVTTAPAVAGEPPLPATNPRSRREPAVRTVRLKPEAAQRAVRDFVPRAGRAIRRIARETWSTSIRGLVVLVIGAFLVTLTLPTTGFNLAMPGYAAPETGVHQEITAASNSDVATPITLGTFRISNYGDLLALRYGSGNFSYSVASTGTVRWPFLYAAPISSPFGARVAPCAACSTYHQGLDFDPKEGSAIYAIADGVVTEVHNDTWGFGRWVVIRHDLNGLVFESIYAHMERKSVELKKGDEVKVSDYVGRVGNTGTSTGAHLHLEIHVDGVVVDPFAFLKKYTD
jgi:murein DD-endopeptidase MepM/ murein hydrolase activator NlpD